MSTRPWREESRSHDVRWQRLASAMAEIASAQGVVEIGHAAADGCRDLFRATERPLPETGGAVERCPSSRSGA